MEIRKLLQKNLNLPGIYEDWHKCNPVQIDEDEEICGECELSVLDCGQIRQQHKMRVHEYIEKLEVWDGGSEKVCYTCGYPRESFKHCGSDHIIDKSQGSIYLMKMTEDGVLERTVFIKNLQYNAIVKIEPTHNFGVKKIITIIEAAKTSVRKIIDGTAKMVVKPQIVAILLISAMIAAIAYVIYMDSEIYKKFMKMFHMP